MSTPSQTNDRSTKLGEVINLAVELGLRGLSTCIPAKVTKWDGKGKVNCQILVQDVTEAEDGSRQVKSWPVITGVPVQFQGAGQMRLTLPVSDGSDGSAATIGTLFFSHRSLDKWLSGNGGEVDPEHDHDHAITDAIFMPGLLPFGAPWQDIPSDGSMSIGSDTDGNGQVVLKKSEVDLGKGATKGVARKDDGVGNGTIAFAFTAGTGGAALSITYKPGDGSATQTLAAGTGTLTIGEKIIGCSQHVKAVD